jgi:CheY-like chemotaxis protein
MAAARDHLRVYRPDVVLIDLGLPDGRGDALIRDLAQGPRRPSVVMGTSGSAEGRALALAAGADGFLDKPLENMAQLCRVLRPLLPELDIHPPPMAPGEPVAPDPLALRDDLAFAQRALQGHPDADRRRYVSAFVAGIARHSQDTALAAAALDAANEAGLAALRAAIDARLTKRADFPAQG